MTSSFERVVIVSLVRVGDAEMKNNIDFERRYTNIDNNKFLFMHTP